MEDTIFIYTFWNHISHSIKNKCLYFLERELKNSNSSKLPNNLIKIED